MFFLFRMAFWLGLVALLLPLGLKGESGREVSVFDAFGAVQAVVADARGFCARQPQACAVGGQMISHLMEKAQVGAKWLHEAVGDQHVVPGTIPPAGRGPQGLDPADLPPAGTLQLTPQDLLPLWGGGDALRPAPPAGASVPASGPLPGHAPLPPRRPA